MSAILTYEAKSENIGERFRYISSILSDSFCSAYKAEPIGDVHRSARISTVSADGVAMCRAQMTPLRLLNSGKINSNALRYCVTLVNRPSKIQVTDRSPVRLLPSEIIVIRNDQEMDWQVGEHYETTSLMIDPTLFQEFIASESDLVGRPIRIPFGAHDLITGLVEAAWDASSAGQFEQAGPKIVRCLLGLLSIASADRVSERDWDHTASALDIRRSQIKAYIDRNFDAPNLSARSISESFRLSSRYVQLALAADNATPSDYIREVRLKNAARLLRRAEDRRRSVTEIAFLCGFNSSSHFATVFRRRFGCSPREFREISES